MVGAVLVADAKPYPKSAQLARGERRYRRKVASPKQWQAIHAEKDGPCRVCHTFDGMDVYREHRELHHVVSREDHGDDIAANIVPLHPTCHGLVTQRHLPACRELLRSLTYSEYAYMIERGGADYPERAYGVSYSRESQR